MESTADGWKVALNANEALVAAFKIRVKKFNELLHPRGADGRFISKGGRVKWRDVNSDTWMSGNVTHIGLVGHDNPPVLTVQKSNGATVSISADKAYGAKSPVATLSNTAKSSMHQIAGQGGSNPGGLYETADKKAKYYIKTPQSDSHAINELLGHKLYAAVGSPTPEVGLSDDKKNFFSKIEESVPWSSVSGDSKDKVFEQIYKDFVVDAWLANWDAPAGDNIRVTEDGVPLRVDTGGALDYRAQGASKVNQLTPEVKELVSMRSPVTNISGAKLYAGVTKEHELDGVKRILALSPDAIREIVSSEGGPDRLADDLIARRAWLATEYGLKLPETTPAGKKALAEHAEKIDNGADDAVDPSLGSYIEKLKDGEEPPLAVGSPVWLKNKSKYGEKLGDIWTVGTLIEGSDKSTITLKSLKGSKILNDVDEADLEALRSNHLSHSAKYSDGSVPNSGDHVILPSGDEGKVVTFYPKYAKVQTGVSDAGKPTYKVVAVSKLALKHEATVNAAKNEETATVNKSAKPATVGIYTSPYKYSEKYGDAQAAMLKSAINAINEYEFNGKSNSPGNYPVYENKMPTNLMTPTQSEEQTLEGGSGKGPSDMKPIAALTPLGDIVLLDGHHRASESEELDVYLVHLTHRIESKPEPEPETVSDSSEGLLSSWKNHDWETDPQPKVSFYNKEGHYVSGWISLYTPKLPMVTVQTNESDPDSLEFHFLDNLTLADD